ncbi:MAG: hypothetical protein UX09_C0013G0012 [Candidatus Uhrbacteria bacterium GW2011_GWE2_45_35]|uniref:DUF5680 domain-containing protein n=2 Tax=Candidatus Uhriibacteriota TaxID=1752732 RepID=A0A0G1LST7_9BACT|nr:MAG: hypothetical protein UW63_C0005G0010 [Candidatus Uhrbacteria bacterium GW2011_GWF2_44_350]KKU08769.1 MAG: hypothetical protein UX09_C0013G0012 [Candidatus Uhrbacteria bacterium GW2011_GWE2_45_35]HBR80313.1 hypothetical protein [Candidatus Uhrbacteria bacterium]HCU31835.1 hypothetical protein [Candidatus Uhrbacteria bacterium]
MSDLPKVAEITAFYLEASRYGYASGEKPRLFGDLIPDAKCFSFSRGSLHYLDVWVSGQPRADRRKHSFGFTIIWCGIQPVWYMRYDGWRLEEDPDKITPFLKKALAAVKTFMGGRGPMSYSEGCLVYQNFWNGEDDIKAFTGFDRIIRYSPNTAPQTVYSHSYGGGLLVDLPQN